MQTLVLLIRKSASDSAFDAALAASIAPFLARFGWVAKTAEAEGFTQLRGGESVDAIHSIRVELDGSSHVDVPTVADKLVRHLKEYAKDTGFDARKFEVLFKVS
jgi:hypothetical protein